MYSSKFVLKILRITITFIELKNDFLLQMTTFLKSYHILIGASVSEPLLSAVNVNFVCPFVSYVYVTLELFRKLFRTFTLHWNYFEKYSRSTFLCCQCDLCLSVCIVRLRYIGIISEIIPVAPSRSKNMAFICIKENLEMHSV